MANESRLLLDTAAFLWAVVSPHRLSAMARRAISDENAELFVSVASIWEMQIKHQLGKLDLPEEAPRLAVRYSRTIGASFLDITPKHIGHLYNLPSVHRDPFDRILIAQAGSESLSIVSPDAVFREYTENIVW